MRKSLARAVCVACAVAMASFSVTACSVSIKAGGGAKKKPPPPPPPRKPPPPPPKKPPPKKAPPRKGGKWGAKAFKINAKGEIELPGPVLFEKGSAQLKPESDEVLNVVKSFMEQKPEVTKLRIEGHTDSDDTNARNMKLSKDRAMSVAHWLKSKGIACNRMVVVGAGEEAPVKKPEVTESDKFQNRRVVFAEAAKNGKPIGGKPLDGGPPRKIAGDACK